MKAVDLLYVTVHDKHMTRERDGFDRDISDTIIIAYALNIS